MEGPRIVVALDYATADEARKFISTVSPAQCRLKVGLELYTATGPDFVRELVVKGFGVFLDLKFHDIPNTVESACRQVAGLGVELLTVHCLGGRKMLEGARRGVGAAAGSSVRAPKILGVTLLTSLSDDDVREVGLRFNTVEGTTALARLAKESGVDGIVCAPTEAKTLRQVLGKEFLLVTPGVRPAGSPTQDQQRVLTPREALQQGSDLLVIGRPITRAPDPQVALDQILKDMSRD